MEQSTETPTLVEFLRVRLDEDEQRARASGQGRVAWVTYLTDDGQMHYTTVAAGTDTAVGPDDVWVADGKELPVPARVLVVYDPARLLREVRTKRWIVDEYEKEAWVLEQGHRTGWTEGGQAARESMLRILAAVYFDHPDYRREWEPARQSRVGG